MDVTGISESEAEDCVATAALRLMQTRPMVTSPPGLLMKTALHLLFDAARRNGSRPALLSIDLPSTEDEDARSGAELTDPSAEPGSAYADRVAEAAAATRLYTALARLPAEDRRYIEAYYLEDQKLKDLDREEGNRVGTAKMRLHRARERFRRAWLESQGGRGRG
jgi:RNA polymerase sigma factor (sigma-70 family)